MKKLMALILVGIMVLGLCACGAAAPAESAPTAAPAAETAPVAEAAKEPTYKWQMATTDYTGKPLVNAMNRFAEAVYEKTNGDIQIEVVADGLLGDYTTNFEDLTLGALEMQANTVATDYDPRLVMTRIPYVASTYDEVLTYMTEGTFYYDELNKVFNDLGVELISNWPAGFQGIGGKSVGDVTTLFDPSIKQDAICRVPSIASTLATCEAFGFQTVTIGYSDLYSALQTGMCDCWMGGTDQDNVLNFSDVVSVYVYANYILQTEPVAMNKALYDSLPAEYQRIIKECAEAELPNLCAEIPEVEKECADKMESVGITPYYPTDEELATFANYVRANVWPKVEEMMGKEFFDGLLKAFNISQ